MRLLPLKLIEWGIKRINDTEKQPAVIRFLAYALMVKQFDLLNKHKDRKIIDISFVPLAPGEPKTLYNRFRITPFPPGGTSRSAPPWTVQGILLWPDLKPTILTYYDLDVDRYVCKEKNSVRVGHCHMRADIYKKRGTAHKK